MTGAAGGERSRLLRALALSRRFHLYLARCASPRAADQLVAALSDELPRLGRAEVRLVRLEPHHGRDSDMPLTDGELAERVLLPLLDPPEELRGAIHAVDASRAAYADTEAWARLFALWNEKRNVLGPSRGEVVVMLPTALAPVFAAAAPDVWSIRSGEYAIEEDASSRGAGPEVQAQGSRSFVGVARVALPALAATGAGSVSGRVDGALLLLRAVPPLALFGGDLVVRPWVENLLAARRAGALFISSSESDELDPSEGAPLLLAQRMLRAADALLAERRFDEAEASYAELLDLAGVEDTELVAVALSNLSIAVAAQDRADAAAVYANRALSLVGVGTGGGGIGAAASPLVIANVLRASALVQWCLGHLQDAERIERARTGGFEALRGIVRTLLLPFIMPSRLLLLIERGQVAAAREQMPGLLVPGPHASSLRRESMTAGAIPRVVLAELEFLSGNIDSAIRALDQALIEGAAWPAEHASLGRRCEVAVALLEIARGNEDRAEKILERAGHAQAPLRRGIEPEGGARVEAFHALTSGILGMVKGDPGGAAMSFDSARAPIADWGRSGLDRRSRLRAQLLIGLLRAALDPDGDGAVAAARDLTRQAEALLGDTAEDHVSRVLAVAAHRELARRLASTGAGDARSVAQRAAALAQPLGNLGVPAWDALLTAAARPI
ncbi:hypothetical protein BE20_23790 [Sorangium cellulosum]|uniref:Uncharacterized protein n=1 Tax=Sorangium cellulosum TaxID=56 RepID=A0A150S6U9_SORCE|nr:hypothetical protein BE20_23790 [Sorangium cellulosum]KYF99215.1 hypothetical protein BE18_26700 [Sorangium cellulosum]